MILLISDGMRTQRKKHLDSLKIKKRLRGCMEHSSPQVKQICKEFLDDRPNEDEVRPEAEEVEVFPTEAHMKQKAKEKRILEETGEKHQPKKKIKIIHPGRDDCGEDFSSLDQTVGNSEAFTITDHVHTPEERAELHVELDQKTELFLLAVETSFTPHHHFFGNNVPKSIYQDTQSIPTITEAYAFLKSKGSTGKFHDVVEICGGQARVSQILISRRNYTVGPNFDLITGIDLLDDKQKRAFWTYMKRYHPLIAIIATPCTGLKGWSGINRIKNHETWLKSRSVSIPLGELGADVAIFQLQQGKEFLSENPLGSDLYHLEGWKKVAKHPRTMMLRVDMCAAGLIDQETKLSILKASEIWYSNERFAESLYDLRCTQDHEHATLQGTYKGENKTHQARIWTWKFAARVAAGVSAIIRDFHKTQKIRAYPVSSSSRTPPPPEGQAPTKRNRNDNRKWKCPMCIRCAHQDHKDHWFDKDCKWGSDNTPGHVRRDWSCEACQGEFPRQSTNPKHTFEDGDCRFYGKDGRRATERIGRHPRDPRRPGHQDGTQQLRMGTEDTRDDTGLEPLMDNESDDPEITTPTEIPAEGPPPIYDEDDEAPLIDEDGVPIAEPPAADLGEIAPPAVELDAGEGTNEVHREDPLPPPPPRRAREREDDKEEGDLADAPRRPRRARPISQGTQAGQAARWTKFDLGKSAQLLLSLNPGSVKRELRRLHMRWHHASAKQMTNNLKMVGVPPHVLKQVGQIVDTCDVCRKLQAPGNKTIATSRVVTKFNDMVQHDIMFAQPHPKIIEAEGGSEDPSSRPLNPDKPSGEPGTETIRAFTGIDVELQTAGTSSGSNGLAQQGRSEQEKEREKKKFKELVAWQHIIDCATRLTQAQIIPNRETMTLVNGADELWFRAYGYPRVIETDQESGLLSTRAKEWCQNRNIELRERPKNAHAQMVERHHRVLRETYMKIKYQCEQEGTPATQKQMLNEAIIAKNTMTTIHGYTPNQAVFGTTSSLMPDLSRGDASIGDNDDRAQQRLREIAIHAIVQATTEERLRRTQLSKTRLSTKSAGIVEGDTVEFWRAPENKEASGWKGPATVVHIDHETGIVHVKWQGRVLLCRPQDVRKSLLSWLVNSSMIYA